MHLLLPYKNTIYYELKIHNLSVFYKINLKPAEQISGILLMPKGINTKGGDKNVSKYY